MYDFIITFLQHPPFRMVFINIISTLLFLIIFLIYRFVYPKRNLSYTLILIGLSVLPLISVLRSGSYESGDINIHVTHLIEFYRSLQSGILIPRWGGDLNATYGYPVFLFLYPLPYYLASLMHFIGFSFLNSIKMLVITTYISSGLFMYYWLKKHVGGKSAFIAAVLYLFAPYRMVDMHFRTVVGELTGFATLPLAFLLIDKVNAKASLYKIVSSGIAIMLLILSHPAVALLGYPVLFIYSLIKSKKNTLSYAKTFLAHILGLLYATFYILPALAEGKYTQHVFSSKLLPPFPEFWQLFYSKWRYGLLYQGLNGELSPALGYAQWIIVIIALYQIIFKRNHNKILILFSFVFLIYFFLTLEISLPVWQVISILRKIQWQFRILALLTFLASALAAYVFNIIKRESFYYLIIFIAIFSTILNWGNRRNTPEIKDPQLIANLPFATSQYAGVPSAIPIWIPVDRGWEDKIPADHLESLNGNIKSITQNRNIIEHTYRTELSGKSILKENTYYFPGWEVMIDGKPVAIDHQNPDYPGIITFNTEKGVHQIEVIFKDTPVRKYSFYISAMAFLFSGVFLLFNQIILKFFKSLKRP